MAVRRLQGKRTVRDRCIDRGRLFVEFSDRQDSPGGGRRASRNRDRTRMGSLRTLDI